MSKKKGFRTALATILVALVIFAALTFAAIKYFLPVYQVSQSDVYSWAVKIYPLLIGITLIVIASFLGKDNNDDESEEDKLPPNSYDAQLFEQPKDDPAAKPKKQTQVPKVEPAPEPETVSDEVLTELASIFGDEPEKEPEPEPVAIPQTEVEEEQEISPFEEIEEVESAEEEPEEVETEEAEPEAEADELEEVEAPTPAPVADEKEDSNKALVNALNALVDKMDDFTSAMIYGTEEEEEEEEDEEPEEDLDEEQYEEYEGDDFAEHFTRIENQISSLADIVAQLADTIKELPKQVVVASAPVEAEVKEPEEPEAEPEVEEEVAEPEAEPEVEEEPEAEPEVEEEVAEPEAEEEPEAEPEPVAQPAPAPAPVDTTGDQVFKSYEGTPAKQLAMAEFDSAKDFGYDLTIANVAAPISTVSLEIDAGTQCVENGDSTLVIIPFADSAEAKEILDKLGVPYDVSTMTSSSNTSFEDFAKDWIN